jgi:hypothetical protein
MLQILIGSRGLKFHPKHTKFTIIQHRMARGYEKITSGQKLNQHMSKHN